MVRILRFFVWSLLVVGTAARAAGPEIPLARDLRAEGDAARSHRLPLMIMFHADYCGYCARMEEEFLKPMLRSGSYEGKVVIRKVTLDPGFLLTDFDGRSISGSELAARYAVSVTPTLLFLDARGNTVADKMVGLSTPDYFGGYLDESIDVALARVRSPADRTTAGKSDRTCHPLC